MLLDGATGTELIRTGMPAGICPEQWILQHPDVIKEIQTRYAKAGANAILAPTFGANRTVLARYQLEGKVTEMNTALAALSRDVANRYGILVGGDLSPTGRLLAPFGDADFEELVSVYAEQVAVLDSLVDFYLCETNMDLASTRAAVIAAKEHGTKPVFVTMTVTESGKTMSGDTPEAALLTLATLGVDAFGLNCSTGPREMASLLTPLVPLSLSLGIPLIAKPNAGAPTSDSAHLHAEAQDFADAAREMRKAGIFILGGCCGTDENHIAALKSMLAEEFSLPATSKIDTARLASTARAVVRIPDGALPAPILPDDDFSDNADEMADEYGFVYVRLDTAQDAENVLETAPFLPAPLAVCGNADAITALCRRFCGKVPVI